MLETIFKFSKTPIASIIKLLSAKTEVRFAKGPPETYFIDDRSLDGINAFHLASRFHGQSLFVIVKFLREENLLESLLTEIQTCVERTPMHMAARNHSPLPLRIFMFLDIIDIDVKDKRGFTALHIASKEGLATNCQLLLDNGAYPNVLADDNYKTTPLHLAKTKNIVNLLIKYGANPFARQAENRRSVMDILLQTHPQAIEEILNLGISTNGQELDSTDLQIIFNFEFFFHEGLTKDLHCIENQPFQHVDEIAGLSKISDSNYKDLLKTPLAEAFLHIKWQLINSLFYCNVGCYAAFLLMLSIMTILLGHMSNCVSDIENGTFCTTYNKELNRSFWNIVKKYTNEPEDSYLRFQGKIKDSVSAAD